MGQSWGSGLSHIPSEPRDLRPASRRRRGVWFWIKQTCLFPFRLLGLFLVLNLLIAGFRMWVIPDMAAQRQVDMVLLVLRILDEEGPGRSFRHLGYEKQVHAGLLDLRASWLGPPPGESDTPGTTNRMMEEVVSVNKDHTPDGREAYLVRYGNGQTQQVVPTTPHTTVPASDLAAARESVCHLFPTRDRKHWEEVLAWGESLFVTSWVQRYDIGCCSGCCSSSSGSARPAGRRPVSAGWISSRPTARSRSSASELPWPRSVAARASRCPTSPRCCRPCASSSA
jgi:hypothetical protein